MMHGHGKSDHAVVAGKPANNAGRSAAEPVEPRAGTKGNAGQQSACRTQGRANASQALERIRQAFAVWTQVGAVCGKAACTDLSGGREVTRVPTATARYRRRGPPMSGRLPGRRVRLTGARTEKSPASISATGLAMTYGFSFTDAVT